MSVRQIDAILFRHPAEKVHGKWQSHRCREQKGQRLCLLDAGKAAEMCKDKE